MARHGSLKAFLPFRRRRDALKIDVSHVAIQSRGISSWGPTKQRAKREATNRARVTSAGSVPQHEHGMAGPAYSVRLRGLSSRHARTSDESSLVQFSDAARGEY